MSARMWVGCAIACNLALAGLSCVPDHGAGTLTRRILFASPALQNFLHIPAFAVLAWLWSRALAESGVRRAIVWATAIAVAYGAIDETIQYFTYGRFASVTDFAFDVIGALAAAAWAASWKRTHAGE